MRAVVARALGIILVALSSVLLLAAPACAHAELLSSSPADGATLDVAPARLLLRFTESVEINRTSVILRDGKDHRLKVGRVGLRGHDGPAGTESPVTVEVALPPLGRGTYHVEWRTLSSDDLHETWGTVVFGVGTQVSPAASGSVSIGPATLLEAAVRWVGFAGLAATLGGVALVARAEGLPRVRSRLWPIVRRGAVTALAACLANGWLAASRSGWAAAEHAVGLRWAAQAVALCAVVAATRGLRQPGAGEARGRRVTASASTAAAAVAAAAATALSGHGVAAGGHWGSVLVAVHLVSTVTWVGGVALLAVLIRRSRVIPGTARSGLEPGELTHLLRRFAVIGVLGFVTSAVSGLLLAGVLVPSMRALTDSGYGRTLVLKVLLVGAAAGLGALTARSVRRPAGRSRHRAVIVEATALLAALAGAALLTAQSPPTSLRWAPDASPPSSGVHTHAAEDLMITAAVAPNRPGPNFLTISVLDTRRPAPAPVTAVDAVLSRAGVRTGISAQPGPHQTWVASTDVLDRSGPWRMTVTAHRPGYPDVTTAFRWTLVPAPGSEHGGAPIGGLLDHLAWTALGLALAVFGAFLRRRRQKAPDVGRPPVPASGPPVLQCEGIEAGSRSSHIAGSAATGG